MVLLRGLRRVHTDHLSMLLRATFGGRKFIIQERSAEILILLNLLHSYLRLLD